MPAVVPPEVDGRRLRREQNREAVLDALVDLWREGQYQPGTAVVAQRAGISARSLFRYFDDVDDLSRAAVERHLADAEPLFAVHASPDQPLAERIAAVVAARLRLYDVIESGARAGRATAFRNPVVAAHLHDTRTAFCSQARALFAPELAGRPDALFAIDVLLSFEARDLLLIEHGLDATRADAVLTTALTALLQG